MILAYRNQRSRLGSFLANACGKQLQGITFTCAVCCRNAVQKAPSATYAKCATNKRGSSVLMNHGLSKQIVQAATDASTIAVDNLRNIRQRTKQRRREQRCRMYRSSHAQMCQILTYKAACGCTARTVDPRHTVQRCAKCGSTARNNWCADGVFTCLRGAMRCRCSQCLVEYRCHHQTPVGTLEAPRLPGTQAVAFVLHALSRVPS